MQSWNHDHGHCKKVEQEEVVDSVADPRHSEEREKCGHKVEDWLLVLGFATEVIGIFQGLHADHNLATDVIELLFLCWCPILRLEDLVEKANKI